MDELEKNLGIGGKLFWNWVWVELKVGVFKRSIGCLDFFLN